MLSRHRTHRGERTHPSPDPMKGNRLEATWSETLLCGSWPRRWMSVLRRSARVAISRRPRLGRSCETGSAATHRGLPRRGDPGRRGRPPPLPQPTQDKALPAFRGRGRDGQGLGSGRVRGRSAPRTRETPEPVRRLRGAGAEKAG